MEETQREEGGAGRTGSRLGCLSHRLLFLLPVFSGLGGPGTWHLSGHPSELHRLILRKGMEEDKVV